MSSQKLTVAVCGSAALRSSPHTTGSLADTSLSSFSFNCSRISARALNSYWRGKRGERGRQGGGGGEGQQREGVGMEHFVHNTTLHCLMLHSTGVLLTHKITLQTKGYKQLTQSICGSFCGIKHAIVTCTRPGILRVVDCVCVCGVCVVCACVFL